MLRIVIREKSGQQREIQVEKEEVVIGRVPSNDLPLPKNNVSKRHAKVVRTNGVWELVDMKSTNGTYVNGQRVDGTHRLSPEDQVIIGDFLLQFEPMDAAPAMPGPPPSQAPPGFGPPGGFAQPTTPAPPPMTPPGPMAPPPMPPSAGPVSPPPMAPPAPPPMTPGGFGGPPGFGGGAPTPPPMAPPAPPPLTPAGASAPPPMTPPGPPTPPPMPPAAGPVSPPPMAPPPTSSAPPFAAGPPAAAMPMGPPGARPPAPPPIGGGARLESRPPIAPPPPPAAPPSIEMPGPGTSSNDAISQEIDDDLSALGDLSDLGLDEVDFEEVGEATDLPAPAVHAPPTLDHVSDSSANIETQEPADLNVGSDAALAASPTLDTPDTTPPEDSLPREEETPVAQDMLSAPPSAPPPLTPAPPTTPPEVHEEHTPPPPKEEPPRFAPQTPAPKSAPPAPTPPPASTPISIPPNALAKAPRIAPSSAASTASKEVSAHLSPSQVSLAKAIDAVVSRLRTEHGALVRTPSKPGDSSRKELKQTVRELVKEMRQAGDIERKVSAQSVINGAISESVGWGPIEELLEDQDITAIVANGAGRIFVEKGSQFAPTEAFFSSEAALERAIQRMVMPRGIRVDRSGGAVEARLADGTWLHAILPPIATQGISLILQPPRHQETGINDLIADGLLSESMQQFLAICIEQRRNILLAGDPGSGRTTLLNALATHLPENERIVSVERVRELNLEQPHWVALETRPPDPHGNGGVSLKALVEHALRIRPQRILLGDIEGNELHALMPRMLLGLDGVMMTARATSPEQLLYRLETLMLSSPEQPPRHALNHQIGAAFDIVIQLNQYGCGTRKVTSICELSCNHEGALYLNEIFAFQKEGTDGDGNVQGHFEATGAQPQFYEDLARLGIELPTDIFNQ